VIYNRRNHARKIINENDLLLVLEEYTKANNLNLIVFEAEKFSIQERFEIYKNAHTIVAPHGGANYNIIFSNPKSKFIECVFIDTMYTLCNLAGGIELDYYLLPDRGDNNTTGTIVNIDKLKLILNKK
jgi:capsular polysaccharide biosynthesis protein